MKTPDELPFVTVVMPVRNEAAHIRRSLGAVLAQDYDPLRLEVLVVDGMSDDATRDIVRETAAAHRGSPVELLDNPGRIAPCALNVGLARAAGEVVARVDGHCEIAPDYVRNGVRHLLADDGVAAVGGPLETVGETPTAAAIAAAMSSKFGVGGSAFRSTNPAAPRAVDTVAFPVYRRRAMERAGRFDEELVRNQDDEYSYRLRRLGGKILLAPDLKVRYYSRGDFRSLWRQYFQYGFWKVRVLQRHPRQMSARQFVPPLFVLALLATAAAAPWSRTAAGLLAATAGSYAVVNPCCALWVAARSAWRHLPRLPLAFAILHLAYGSGFLLGLAHFWRWWLDRPPAPGEER